MKKWLKLSVNILRKKLFGKFGLQEGKIGPLRTLRRRLHMCLDILKFRLQNKPKSFRENCFENAVSDL